MCDSVGCTACAVSAGQCSLLPVSPAEALCCADPSQLSDSISEAVMAVWLALGASCDGGEWLLVQCQSLQGRSPGEIKTPVGNPQTLKNPPQGCLLSLLVALMLNAPLKKKKLNEQDTVVASFWRLGRGGGDGESLAVTHGLQWAQAASAGSVLLSRILSCVQ